MKLHFERNQEYQIRAIKSVIDSFEGQPMSKSGFNFSFADQDPASLQFSTKGVGNNLQISYDQLLRNINKVQVLNNLTKTELLNFLEYSIPKDIEKDIKKDSIKKKGKKKGDKESLEKIITSFPNLSVEMETGTGKTYVYIRTIYELHAIYGFKKFVIVVPSVAIREGVLKSLEITNEHFQELYNNEPLEFKMYDSGKLSILRNFAVSNTIQILVINIDSFTKDHNVINQKRETGIKPIQYIQGVNPIVIVDEPQNMETDIRKKAIHNLNPLCTIRYSATHKHIYNQVYKLDPVRAYDLGLVKQIEVDSVLSRNDSSGAYINLEDFIRNKKSIVAKLSIFVNDKNGAIKKSVKANVGDNLYELSNRREIYKEGYIINEIDAENNCIELSNGIVVKKGESQGGITEHILKEQVEATIQEHFKKEKELNPLGIKVLSIFFIDRVAHYRSYDEAGNPIKGKFALWFEEIFNKWQKKSEYRDLYTYTAAQVHNGYFSQDKGKFKDTKEGKSTKADDDTYALIMKDKERLLDLNEPLRFIFSHSALREGWDNPNVFQICTLSEAKSEIRKRQEIGRGLRLAVDQSGKRVYDRNINRLTVVANESYEDFAEQLQKEIEEECGVQFKGRIKDKRNRIKVELKKGFNVDQNFLDLWDKIKHKTQYRVVYSTADLINNSATAIKNMPRIAKPTIERVTTSVKITDVGVVGQETNLPKTKVVNVKYDIPDFVAYIQAKTELTRNTLTEILLQSGRLKDVLNNPQLFMDSVVKEIKQCLQSLMVNGIRYERIAGQEYKMELFEAKEIESYTENLLAVKNQNKTLYNYIEIDSMSTPEQEFAQACENSEGILFYIKLPSWFQISTPIGPYNPDWALLYKDDSKLYFVAETKSTQDRSKLRDSERMKIHCGEKHFEQFPEVTFKVVSKASQLLEDTVVETENEKL